MHQKIDNAFQNALAGIRLNRSEIIELLKVDTFSDECVYLRKKASEASRILTGNKAYMWGAIGLDYSPCTASCDFCSFGSSWGLIEKENIYTLDAIIPKIREYVDNQVHFIALRTTQYYSLETLTGYLKAIREEVKGDYELIANVGEFDVQTAKYLYENGANGAYHAVRIREGIDTRLNIEDRKCTLSAINQSPLYLVHLVEPVGVEHSYEEIADRFLCSLEYGVYISGIMARVPVKGTPLGDLPRLSDEEMAKMIAVLRLSGGKTVQHICVHPASELAVQSGANVVCIETGAVPRDKDLASGKWQNFDYNVAKDILTKNDFVVTI